MLEGATLEQRIVLPGLVECYHYIYSVKTTNGGEKCSRLVVPNHLGEMDDLTLEQGAHVRSKNSTQETPQNSP